MRFLHSSSLTVFTRLLSMGLTGLTTIIIARTLGPSGQGIIAAIIAFITLAIQFGSLGLYSSNIYFVSKNKNLFKKAAGNSLTIGILLGSGLLLLVLLSTKISPQIYGNLSHWYLLIYAIAIPFILISQLFSGLLLAIDKIKEYNAINLTRSLFTIFGVSLLLLILKKGILEIIFLSVSIEIFISFLYLLIAYSYKKFKLTFAKTFFIKMMKYGLKFYLAAQLAYLVYNFDIFMVNYFLGANLTGIYSISAKMANSLLLIPGTIATIFFPKASALGEKKARLFTNKVLLGILMIMFSGCLFSYFLAKPVMLLLFGSAYLDSIFPFQILIPGIFFISLEIILMTYFASRGMPLFAILAPLLGLMVNIILNIKFIPLYGINGAALSSTIAYAFMFFMLFCYYLKR